MTQPRFKWYTRSAGGSGCYIFGSLAMLVAMLTDTAETFAWAGFLVMALGVPVFCFGLDRLIRINVVQARPSEYSKGEIAQARTMRTTLIAMAIGNLSVLVLAGLIWIFGAVAQCTLQALILGVASKESCPQSDAAFAPMPTMEAVL